MKAEDIKITENRIIEEDKLIDEFIKTNSLQYRTIKQKTHISAGISRFLEYVALKHNKCLKDSDIKLNC